MPIPFDDGRWTHHHRNWGWVLAYGLLLAAAGLIALVEPLVTGLVTGLFIGMILLWGGVFALIAGFSERGWQSRWLDIATGILGLLLGMLVFWQPLFGAFSIVGLIGLWLFVSGIMELAAGFRSASHRVTLILLGVVDIVLGVYLFFAGPLTALIILSVLIGLSFLFRGALLCTFAFRLRRIQHG